MNLWNKYFYELRKFTVKKQSADNGSGGTTKDQRLISVKKPDNNFLTTGISGTLNPFIKILNISNHN